MMFYKQEKLIDFWLNLVSCVYVAKICDFV